MVIVRGENPRVLTEADEKFLVVSARGGKATAINSRSSDAYKIWDYNKKNRSRTMKIYAYARSAHVASSCSGAVAN